MADIDHMSIYRQFFEEFAKTVNPEDPLPIRAPGYTLTRDEINGEVMESCIQYLTLQKCPQSLLVPLVTIAFEEIQKELKKSPKNVDPLNIVKVSTSKINEICLRFMDSEKLKSLPPPVKEPYISHHGIKHVRRKMEDKYVCIPRFNSLYNIPNVGEASYYGLFDGHSGTEASSFAVSHLHQFLIESQHYPHEPVLAFKDAYQKTEVHYSNKNIIGGTTAVAVLHQHNEKRLVVTWLGDSQAMLVKQEGYLMLTDPHKPCRKDEYERIEKLGGFVTVVHGYYRTLGHLAVSRAIGDNEFKPFVSAEPDIRVIELSGSEEFLVVACDGLWDVVESEEVITAVYSQVKDTPDNIESVSKRLVELAKANNSRDNISVIVVFFSDPVDISKRSVEAIGPGPNNLSRGEMNTNFQTATDISPFKPIGEPGMNKIYEENGSHTDYMDQAKDDSDEDLGPETDIDSVDDILVAPNKSVNPFGSNIWKNEGADCNDLIDYPKPEDLSKDKAVDFTDNINNYMKDDIEDQVEGIAVSETLDNIDVNQMNTSNLVNMEDDQSIKFTNYNFVNNEFIEDAKFEKEIEKSPENPFAIDNRNFVGVNDYPEFDNFKNNDFETFAQKSVENEVDVSEDLFDEKNQILCNGNTEVYQNDKFDDKFDDQFNIEKPVSPISAAEETVSEYKNVEEANVIDTNVIEQPNEFNVETNIEKLKIPQEEAFPLISPREACDEVTVPSDLILNDGQISSDSENMSQKEVETPELLSPLNQTSDADGKLKDDIVTESGEVDSEEEEWKYIKFGSGTPADEQLNLVGTPEPVLETENLTMNSPLNPNAAEFVPVSPIPNPVELDGKKTPLRSVPPSVNDIIASSPNWSTMDNVDVPDEVSFLNEIKQRPSNILTDKELSLNDAESLGCTDINIHNQDSQSDVYAPNDIIDESLVTENLIVETEQHLAPSPVCGIALANDMTSSFIDPSTMSSNDEGLQQEIEMFSYDKEAVSEMMEMLQTEPMQEPLPMSQTQETEAILQKEIVTETETLPAIEIQTNLNVNAAEFKSEPVGLIDNHPMQLPDLLSPLPVEEEIKKFGEPELKVKTPETDIADNIQPVSPVALESPPMADKSLDLEMAPVSIPEVMYLKREKLDVGDLTEPEVKPTAALIVSTEAPPETKIEDTLVTATVAPVATPADTCITTPAETYGDTSTDISIVTLADTPVANLADTPVANLADTPIANLTDTPIAILADTPVDTLADTPVTTLADTPVAASSDTPVTTLADTPTAIPADPLIATPIVTPTTTPVDAAVAASIAEKKEEPKKGALTAKTTTSTTSKVTKSAATPKTPPTTAKTVPPAKKPLTSPKPSTTKPVNNTPSPSVKSATSKVSTAPARTVTSKTIAPTLSQRPSTRRTTPTTSTVATKTTTTAGATKPSPARISVTPSKTSSAPRPASTASAPKPKPRVPSAPLDKKLTSTVEESKTKRTEVLTKKPASSGATTVTRTVASRPATAPIKSTVKTAITTTATRTTTTKPRTALTGVSTTTTTQTTRTVLNSKKPLSVSTKEVANKASSKSGIAKVNGLANGTKKTTITSTTTNKTKIENKTETKAEKNMLNESVDIIEKAVIENGKDVNLINGIGHD